MMFESV